jgi:hypothetical protein
MSGFNITMSDNKAGGDIVAFKTNETIHVKKSKKLTLYEQITDTGVVYDIDAFLEWMTVDTVNVASRGSPKFKQMVYWRLTYDKTMFLLSESFYKQILSFLEDNGFPKGGFVFLDQDVYSQTGVLVWSSVIRDRDTKREYPNSSLE